MNHHIAAAGLAVGLFICLAGHAAAQTPPSEAAASPLKDEQSVPVLSAHLIDADQKAQKKSATIIVQVRGVKIVDPGSVNEKPAKG